MTKTKLALTVALILGSASMAVAQSEFGPKPGDRLNDRRAPTYNTRPVGFDTNPAVRGVPSMPAAMPERTTTAPSHG